MICHQFSTKRVVGSFILDLTGTLIALFLATSLRVAIENSIRTLPDLLSILQNFWIETGWPTHLLIPQVILLVIIIWPFFFVVFRIYVSRCNTSRKAELANVFLAVCTAIFVLTGVLFLTYREISRLLFMFFFAFTLLFFMGWWVSFYLFRYIRNVQDQAEFKPVPILVAGEVGEHIAEELSKYAARDIKVVGFLDDDPDKVGDEIAGYPVLGNLDQILDFSKKI